MEKPVLNDSQKLRLVLKHKDFIRADAQLTVAKQQAELSFNKRAQTEQILTQEVERIATELGLNTEENRGRYSLDLETLGFSEVKQNGPETKNTPPSA